jgi:hypothetical protein
MDHSGREAQFSDSHCGGGIIAGVFIVKQGAARLKNS